MNDVQQIASQYRTQTIKCGRYVAEILARKDETGPARVSIWRKEDADNGLGSILSFTLRNIDEAVSTASTIMENLTENGE